MATYPYQKEARRFSHGIGLRVLETEFDKKIRPFPKKFRPPGKFAMCPHLYDHCTRFPNCTYAHSRPEQRCWNRMLKSERDTNSCVIKSTYRERKRRPPCTEDTKLSVTVKNYRKKYKALLFYEEEEHVRLLAKNCNGRYTIKYISRGEDIDQENYQFCASICGMTPNQILYALQASGEVFITCPQSSIKAYKLSSNYSFLNDCLYIGLYGYNAKTLQKAMRCGISEFDVKFEVNHFYFNNLHYSVDIISDEALKRIVPCANDFKDGLHLGSIPHSKYSVQLDSSQSKALQTMVFSRSSAPVLIPGPFGSGKTRLLSVAAEYFIDHTKRSGCPGRVLLCCHQQDSADIFMKQYFLKIHEKRKNPSNIDVVRVTSQAHSKAQLRYCIPFNEFREKKDKYRSKRYLVVVTTFLTALRMCEFIPPDFFTHILIDEGAQAREPECIAPLCMANKNTRIVIVGDSKQVGPKLLVLGKLPAENGLGESLLERLHTTYQEFGDRAKQYAIPLCNNYRCHAALLKLSSDLFYESSLVARGKIQVVAQHSLRFICSCLDKNPASFSDNEIEAKIIIREVENLLCTNTKVDASNVCIMSPSQRQVSLIRRLLNQVHRQYRYDSNMRRVRVLPSYKMQGQEFQVLFLSTVECVLSSGKPFDPLKSLCHPAIFNTAITRAQSLVVAVGNPFTLMKAETTLGNPKNCWKQFISICQNIKSYDDRSYLEYTGRRPIRIVTKTEHALPVVTASRRDELPKVKPQTTKDDFIVGTSSVRHVPVSKPQRSLATEKAEISKKQQHGSMPGPVNPRHEIHNQDRHHVPEQLVITSSKSARVNAKQSSNQTSEKISEVQCSQVFPIQTRKDFANVSQKEAKRQKPSTFNERNTSFYHSHQPIDEELLKAPINIENYRQKFHQLLCREEEEHENILVERCDGRYRFSLFHHDFSADYFREFKTRYVRFGFLTAGHDYLDGDKIAYAKQASEGRVNLQLCNSSGKTFRIKANMVFPLYQTKEGEETIYLALDKTNLDEIIRLYPSIAEGKVSDVSVTFVLKYSYFHRLHKVIDILPDTVLKRIMPDSVSDFTQPTTTVHSRSDTTLISCVEKFVFLDQLRHEPHVPTPQMYALYKIINSDCSKAPVLTVGSFGTGKTRVLARAAYHILYNNNEAKVLVCAHHQASVDSLVENYFGKMMGDNWCPEESLVRIIPNDQYRCKPEYWKYYKTAWEIQSMNKQSLKLVVTTFLTSLHLLEILGQSYFTHILLDEGAQTREPEIIAPLCLANENTKIVIMGDHKQVGPSILVLGEKARENGLKYSLLERLYTVYSKEELEEASKTHCAILLTNFRSHHALLSLPSYLFYSSALMTVAEATTQLHPDAGHPLHFICSSLDQDVQEVSESSNIREIELIFKEVRKFVNNWPKKEWGERNLSSICIMTTTANQKSCCFEMRNKSYKDIKGVEILTVYDIQGREFQAIFLSTAEPTFEDGSSKNPTKSPCGQYVFNTAITRAKSLVVCAGNPFLLMKIEKLMNNEQPNCWRDFIRRCMITRTFHVPSSTAACTEGVEATLHQLQLRVFPDNLSASSKVTEVVPMQEKDFIIFRLQETAKKLRHNKNCKLQIQEQQNDQRWTIVDDHKKRTFERDDSKGVTCELAIKTTRNAIAIPLDSSKDGITINGFNHRRGAFDGDIVTVHLLGTSEDTGQKYGRVVKVLEAHHPTKYVCRADQYNIINFYPIDRTVPGIVNLPKISRKILQYNSKEFSESQRGYITVFEEASLDGDGDDLLPRIKDLISLETAPSLLFVVKVLSWSPKYRKPLGAVVEALPQTNNMFITEKLLRIANNIDPDEIESFENIATPLHNQSKHKCQYDRAFTIDPPDAINLDDALSLVPVKENIYQLAVLITNVAKHIEKDSILDKYAQCRGVSIYDLQNRLHMLPSDFTVKTQSLICGEIKDAIVITAEVKIDGGEVTEVVSCSSPENTTTKSMIKLCYKSAQQLLNSETPETDEVQKRMEQFNSTGKLSITETLKLLFKIAMNLRIKRLGDAAYCYQISDPGEEENWQSHLLVEELMIWANNLIAKYLYEHLPRMSILHRHLPPLAEESSAVKKTYEGVLDLSLSLKSLSLQSVNEQPLLMTTSTLQAIQNAYKIGDKYKLTRILSNDQLYPQLAIVHSSLISISRQGEYICTCTRSKEDMSLEKKSEDALYSHYSLSLSEYTHFTSPIRRYVDIVVQRLVNALISSSDISYSEDELRRLCRHLNMKKKMAKKFAKDMKRVELASNCEDGFLKTEAYLTQSMTKQRKFELCFSSNKYNSIVLYDDRSFDQSQLNYFSKEKGSVIEWHVVSIPFSSPDFLLKCPEITDFEKGSESDNTGMHSSIQADVFYLMGRERDADIKSKSRKRESFIAHIMDGMVEINPNVWKLSHDCIKTPSEENISNFIKKLPSSSYHSKAKSNSHYSKFFEKSPIISYIVTRSFRPGEVLNVWLGKSVRRPIASPGIHLIEIAPTVRVCVQHNQSPVMCFSGIELCLASKSQYRSESEYVELWSKALLAEAASDGVKTKTLVLFKDAKLVWPDLIQSDTCIDKLYFKPEGSLSLEIPQEKIDMIDFLSIQPGDLVCSRYDLPNSLSVVYHFVIHKVEDVKDVGIRLSMRPVGEHGCRVSQGMEEELIYNPECELQVIKMPDSFNRLFHRLQCMEHKQDASKNRQEQWSELATKVALGTLSKQSRTHSSEKSLQIKDNDPFAKHIWGENGIELNNTQKKAIESVLNNRFHLIQGPPGTGKSVTGAHLAYIFARANSNNNQCVLYCGPSNKAVDVVHDKLVTLNSKLNLKKKLRILRLYGRTYERQDFPNPVHTLKLHAKDEGEGICQEKFKGDALHYKIRVGDENEIEKIEEEFRGLLKRDIIPSALERKRYRDCIAIAEKKELGKSYDIILCTCNETCSKRLLALYGSVAQCIVDECGMANEPETLAAMSLCEHVVLIGDHMQLQPVVKCYAARQCGLNTSLFQRCAEQNRELLTRLDIQYRMHPSICKGPSKLFYDDELEADVSVKRRMPLRDSLLTFWPRRSHDYPVMFCNILGKEEEDMTNGKKHKKSVDTHSKSNLQEAEKALELIEILLKDHKLDCEDIAVLTPYAAQENLLLELMKERDQKERTNGGKKVHQMKFMQDVRVSTIIKSQGDEYNIVILSIVRSLPLSEIANPRFVQPDQKWMKDNLGFLTDSHQVNVGITRAKYGLIIIGNKVLLEYDKVWNKLIQKYEENNCVV